MYFGNYRLSKTCSGNSLKSAVSQHPLPLNNLKDPEHLWNLHESTFIIFFQQSEEKWREKIRYYWSLKS